MQNLKWAYGNYYISVWGKPDTKTPWGLNFGGHHMALLRRNLMKLKKPFSKC